MRSVGSFFYTLALAFWVGGGALYTFVLTPAIFAAYPRNTAGEIVGTMMPHYFRFQLAAAAVAALLMIALWRAWPGRSRVLCLGLVLGALRCNPSCSGGSILRSSRSSRGWQVSSRPLRLPSAGDSGPCTG